MFKKAKGKVLNAIGNKLEKESAKATPEEIKAAEKHVRKIEANMAKRKK